MKLVDVKAAIGQRMLNRPDTLGRVPLRYKNGLSGMRRRVRLAPGMRTKQFSSDKYLLDARGNPRRAKNLAQWSIGFEEITRNGRRFICNTDLGYCRVSTVFLGLDHNWMGGPPLVFESMAFWRMENDKLDYRGDHMTRYATRRQAIRGHEKIVEIVKQEHERHEEIAQAAIARAARDRGAS